MEFSTLYADDPPDLAGEVTVREGRRKRGDGRLALQRIGKLSGRLADKKNKRAFG
jgi:hypothetical protein